MNNENKTIQNLSEKEELQMDLISNAIIDIILDSKSYRRKIKQSGHNPKQIIKV